MVIDEKVNLYRNGACFAMSAALHRLTAHPERCIDYGMCTHAFVVTESQYVLDIHGEHSWDDFLGLLVKEGVLPAEAVALGKVKHLPIPGEESINWRHRGYKPPSETAINKAISVAKRHPNLAEHLSSYVKPKKLRPN